MSRDIGVVIALPAELKHRVDAMAAQVGLSAQTLMLAWVLQGLKGPRAPIAHTAPAPETVDDAWRGAPDDDDDAPPTSDVDVDAMIANRVAEAESAGLAEPPGEAYEAFGPPTAQVAPANVRALRRPPPQFAPANQASHLRSL